ncbi:putative F-box domain-containing protein [Medicago truncatula]|uniref:F-box protein interaction domain protein n=2 Tax=Medicago truncatula TaxID=3880 RepID=G7K4Y0_MEDTR|nr:F-box protein interaction domain protein [Medicago truncatula]RHN58139.1 putative F-box domain-containing protein [Medicago truncatula]
MKNCAHVIKATNENVKVRNQSHIPNDLFFFILSKMSIKSLKRFGCVHKSWSLLFDNLYFMTMYRNSFLTKNHPYYDDTSVLLHQTFHTYLQEPYQLQTLSGERFEKRVNLDWPSVKLDPIYLHKEEYDSGFNIIGSGSVHGTICLLCASQENIILWNPSNKEFKLLPPSPFDSEPYWGVLIDHRSFGYDRVRDDYKVMCHGQVIQKYNYGIYSGSYIWEIYSLRSNSWRKINVDMEHNHMDCEQVYLDGLAHWMCSNEGRNQVYLLSFD